MVKREEHMHKLYSDYNQYENIASQLMNVLGGSTFHSANIASTEKLDSIFKWRSAFLDF